ncbi:GNAT family N-acetyltransferase [Pseudonocardia sp.]|uniref:GNAT family N-acetyltransferase n=1 Tax=Pseudonocardia sp. TaxID=60912 RepID=UPI003D14BBCF
MASAEQFAEIRRLLHAAYADYRAAVDPQLFRVYLADVTGVTSDVVQGGAIPLVALDGGTIVGTARVFPHPQGLRLPDGAAYVRGVAVRPGREGEGIAAALMAACAERARAGGATSVHLHTTPFMTRAIHLYERLGYRRDPGLDTDSHEHYGLAVEPRLHALALRLDLTGPRRPPSA